MKNRKFLASLTALAAVIASDNSIANAPNEKNTIVADIQNSSNRSNNQPFDFILRNSTNQVDSFGNHRSHMSHRSHSSHQSHYSGY
jgi:hypothetical protein